MTLQQAWPMPSAPRPIVIIGTGGIVKDAHLPAYRKAGFTVAGLYDPDRARAQALADEWAIPTVFASLAEAAEADAVFDVAAPPVAHREILATLRESATVLLQKPMGLDLAAATEIRDIARARRLTASVNFQLRYSAMMLAIGDAIRQGRLGELTEIEVHINLVTPWQLFPHLKANPRVEIVSHSIHYLDAIRALVGDPRSVFARSFGHPASGLADTRSSMILDYGDTLRVLLSINHHHDFGRQFQDAQFRVEGVAGAAVAKFGVLLDYPAGEPDELWLAPRGGPWDQAPLTGAWFPDAFIGPMANLQRFSAGEDLTLLTAVDDAWQTMALVEAAYLSNDQLGTPMPRIRTDA
ncbi:Gfo/Idh/MocA family protein [Sphingomonas glacialis]|uniref:Gfo/Idh/MocA family oxidoreductase n=1 Tax=Sphingomonas glacialis TaxID=658225 RepID=A0A502FRT8_9SPHN|nr:Gfo/Idh/MocA family oxidoreductase [Sphingomonas glacialis]TPG52131.1 gfo/Idh/MocA family oxidoreductase [Sphingomonas glacialis]